MIVASYLQLSDYTIFSFLYKIPGIGTGLCPFVSGVEGSSFPDIPRLASVDVKEFTTSLTNAGMSPLVKGALASESTAGLLPLPDVDGCMTGVDTLVVVLLVLVAPGAAAVDLRFLFFGGIAPISTSLSVLALLLSNLQSNQTGLSGN